MPQTNPQSGANSSSSSSNSSDDKTSSPLPTESYSSMDKTMIEKLAKKTSGLLRGDRRKRHKHPPGVILMLERGEWAKAATRAKKYSGECKVWTTIRKTSPGGGQANDEDNSQSGSGSSLLSLAIQGSYSSIGTHNTASSTTDSSVTTESSNGSDDKDIDSNNSKRSVSSIKCKAIHHACHRLRSIHSYRTLRPENTGIASCTHGTNGKASPNTTPPEEEDEWVEACKCILTLIEIHPEACGDRESRHGCLPLHLAAFAMCETPPPPSFYLSNPASYPSHNRRIESLPPPKSLNSHKGLHKKSGFVSPSKSTQTPQTRPKLKTRSFSHGSSEMSLGGISAMISAENVAGGIECKADLTPHHLEQAMMEREDELQEGKERTSSPTPPPESAIESSPQSPSAVEKCSVVSPPSAKATIPTTQDETKKAAAEAARQHYLKINTARREQFSLLVLNALLDAYPKGVRVDSEGGRLPLHTAVAGRATAGVISTLIKAYPGAARQRTKDGYLPLHLAAYWGVSHPEVAPMLLRAYPDATLGRNRWERTPLEEALVMAGENGRPHQIELVKSLRRHPDYWARPNVDMGGLMLSPSSKSSPGGHVKSRSRPSRAARELAAIEQEEGGKHLVDVDETIADLSSDEDEFNCRIIEGDDMPLLINDENDSKHGVLNRFSPKNLIHKTIPRNHHNGAPPLPNRSARSNKLYTNPLHEELSLDLFQLIKSFSWLGVISRLDYHPTEAAEVRPVTVRGGYGAKVSPLYAVCERNPPLDVVESLIEVCPDATSSRKVPGSQLPLHAACTWRASSGVVGLLLAAHPAGAKARDDFSNLPLHCACFSGADTAVIESLVCTYPRGVWARNGQGSTAADIVRRLRHPNRMELLHLLEKRSLDLMLKRRKKLHQNDMVIAEQPIAADGSFDENKHSAEDLSDQDDDAKKSTVEDGSDDEDDGMMWI